MQRDTTGPALFRHFPEARRGISERRAVDANSHTAQAASTSLPITLTDENGYSLPVHAYMALADEATSAGMAEREEVNLPAQFALADAYRLYAAERDLADAEDAAAVLNFMIEEMVRDVPAEELCWTDSLKLRFLQRLRRYVERRQ